MIDQESCVLKGDFGGIDLLLAHFGIMGSRVVCHQFPDEEKATWLPLYKQTDECWR